MYIFTSGTYYETYEVILNELNNNMNDLNNNYILLGNHINDEDITYNKILSTLLNEVTDKSPLSLFVNHINKRNKLIDQQFKFIKEKRKDKIKMLRLLRLSGVINGNSINYNVSQEIVAKDIVSPLINYKDRTLLTKSLIYKNPFLYNSTLSTYEKVKGNSIKTLIYLDVSGSVNKYINELASLLRLPF